MLFVSSYSRMEHEPFRYFICLIRSANAIQAEKLKSNADVSKVRIKKVLCSLPVCVPAVMPNFTFEGDLWFVEKTDFSVSMKVFFLVQLFTKAVDSKKRTRDKPWRQ